MSHHLGDGMSWEAVSAPSPGACKQGSSSLFFNMEAGEGWTEKALRLGSRLEPRAHGGSSGAHEPPPFGP